MITGSAAPPLPSFLRPFYFRLRALSIQRTRLSRSLQQASLDRTKLGVYQFQNFVYCCHSNIDFTKAHILTNFKL